MSGGLPDERQLRDIEQRVLTRIRRHAAMRSRVASGAVVAALVVGAVVLVRPAIGGATGSAASSGEAGGSSAYGTAASAAEVIRCHIRSDAGSPWKSAPLPAHPTAASVAAACAADIESAGPTFASREPVVCRSPKGAWEVFPADAHRATLCTRNGLTAG